MMLYAYTHLHNVCVQDRREVGERSSGRRLFFTSRGGRMAKLRGKMAVQGGGRETSAIDVNSSRTGRKISRPTNVKPSHNSCIVVIIMVAGYLRA